MVLVRKVCASRAALVVACLVLWVCGHYAFTRSFAGRDFSIFRLDRGEAVAYPASDARQDFMDGLAILSGDGWVNWRPSSRWSVYKPGWGAALGLLALVCDRDPARMQFVLSWLLAASCPAFYLALLALYPVPRMRLLGFVAALAFLLSPPGPSWWFINTMTTEGPTLLLSLLLCGLAVRTCNRESWSAREAMVLGALMGAVVLVRTQSRFAVLAALAPMLMARRAEAAARGPFLACLTGAFLCVVGPLFLKTSYHLGHPYFGTSHQSLVAVLAWTDAGKAVGGSALHASEAQSEAQAISVLSRRARRALRESLRDPVARAVTAARKYVRFSHSQLGGVFRPMRSGRLLMVGALALSGLGLVWAIVLHGWGATIPLFYSLAYLAPNFAFSFYWDRFGLPVCWVGPLYASGGLVCLLEGRAAWKRVSPARTPALAARAPSSRRRSYLPLPRLRVTSLREVWLLLTVSGWLAGCTAGLLAFDHAPLRVLESSSSDSAAGLGHHGREQLGVAFLPLTVRPNDPPLVFSDGVLEPRAETYVSFFFAVPWKLGNGFQLRRYSIRGALYEGFRNGDWVRVSLPDDPAEFYVRGVVPAR